MACANIFYATFAASGRSYCMSLAPLRGVIVPIGPDRPGWSWGLYDQAYATLFQRMGVSGSFFTAAPNRNLLDIGSGKRGSEFVNRFAQNFPHTRVVSLDSDRESLSEGVQGAHLLHSVCGDARRLPFADASFHIAFAGHIIHSGVSVGQDFWEESYGIVAEAFRILVPGGILAFTYGGDQDQETSTHLREIGFRKIAHLLRTVWYVGIPADVYAVRKPMTARWRLLPNNFHPRAFFSPTVKFIEL